jgi:hypothetical protein
MGVDPAFAALRERLERGHREATAAAFVLGDEALVRTGLGALDAALGGGFPRGTVATLEGPPSSGRSTLAARLLATATRRGLGAADIIVRSGAFTVVILPTLPSGRGTGAAMWSRLASLTHRANALLVAAGDEASNELCYVASVRLATAVERVRWNGPAGHLSEFAGFDVRAVVRKHKRAAPVGDALVRCEPFEERPPLVDVRERTLVAAAAPERRALTS